MFVPNFFSAVPLLILGGLSLLIVLIVMTQGNTVASMLICAGIGLAVLWSLDTLTLSMILFALVRLVVCSLLFTMVSSVVLWVVSQVLGQNRIVQSMWLGLFFCLSVVASLFIGHWIAVSDYPHLSTTLEEHALAWMDQLVAQASAA